MAALLHFLILKLETYFKRLTCLIFLIFWPWIISCNLRALDLFLQSRKILSNFGQRPFIPGLILFIYIKIMRLVLLLLMMLLHLAAPQKAPLAITFVSGSPNSMSNPVYSSLRGGRYIYIKAMGHNLDPTKNIVAVGTSICTIPSDGVTDTFIVCQTPDSGSISNITNLSVSLITSTGYVSTTNPNTVFYSLSHTPLLSDIYPTAGFAGSKVNFYGLHRITNIGDGLKNMGDIIKLAIG